MTTRIEKKIKKQKLTEALKEFTRAKALFELNNGANPKDSKFTTHRNYHVRMRAFHLSGGTVPENKGEAKSLFDTLVKGRSDYGKAKLEAMFFPPEPEVKNKQE
jgi:hypothetical protein